MSAKKDRWNHRRYRRAPNPWNVPSDYKRWNSCSGTRWIRARSRQMLREGRYEGFPRYFRDSGWHYW